MESTSTTTSVSSPKNPFLKNLKNPFVGLRPFEPTENLLFFGRDKQITELVERLRSFHFMAVVGNSGCGKSSLIRAGLIPNLKRGFLQQQYDSWQFAIMRPGNDPLYFLSESILKSNLSTQKAEDAASQYNAAIEFKKEIIGGGSTVVYKKIEEISKSSGEQSNYFILVDQFEELFDEEIKYKPGKDDQPAVKYKVEDNQINFINILLDLAKQTHLPIYIVITMRSDFLGHCNRFFGLPEVMNQGQYLVPRLDREQRRAAIEGPIYLFKARISNVLLNKLLDDSDASADELPVLQHALMRTWVGWKKQTPLDREQPEEEISLANYEAAGGMEKALSNHANEIYDTLVIRTDNPAIDAQTLEKNQEIARIIFKSLTKIDEKGRRIRRPQEFAALNKLCASLVGSTSDDLKYVINAFREEGNAFLSPYKGGLYDDTEIDISHESLIRKWDKLNDDDNEKGWISIERDSAKEYIDFANNVQAERKLQQSDLNRIERWKKRNKISNEWAERYGGGYDAVMNYIKNEKERLKSKKIISGIAIAISTLGIIVLVFLFLNDSLIKHQNAKLKEHIAIKQWKDTVFLYDNYDVDNKERGEFISAVLKFQLDSSIINMALPSESIDSVVFKNISSTLKARQMLNSDPASAIDSFKQIAKNSNHPLVQHLLSNVFKDYVFSISGIDFSSSPSEKEYEPKIAYLDKNKFILNLDESWANDYSSFIYGRILNNDILFDTAISSFSNVLFAAYSSNNLILLKNNGDLIEQNKKIGTIKDAKSYEAFTVNANGNILMGINTKEEAKLWKIHPFKEINIKSNVDNNNIKQINISDDGKYMLVSKKKKVDIINILKPIANPFSLSSQKQIDYDYPWLYANFISKSNYIIACYSNTAGSIVSLKIYDSTGQTVSNLNSDTFPKVSFLKDQYSYFELSQDWKKLIAINGNNLVLFEAKNRDSIFVRFKNGFVKTPDILECKKFANLDHIEEARFIDNDNVITMDKKNNFKLWKTNIDFKDLTHSFEQTKAATTYSFHLENYKFQVRSYAKKITSLENLLASYPGDSLTISKLLSSNYWNLSWNQILVKDYKGAIQSAQRGFKLYKENTGILTNLALGHLLLSNNFNDDYEKAKGLYLKYRDSTYTSISPKKFIDAFNEDIQEVINDKIVTANDERIIKILKLLNK